MKTCPSCQAGYPTSFAVCPQDGTPLVEIGAWVPGSVLRGKYRILEKIGQGGMGAVYKALHVTFDELRAIKVISPELVNDQLFVKRFKHEAVITRKLQHPNAVRVDDIDEADDGRPFIVMEFIEGQSLRKLIEEQGAMPVARVCLIMKQAAAALEAAHRLGMIHRDIKPDNIVLVDTPEGEEAKVLDFGIAKIKEGRFGDTAGMTLTGTGVVIGTPQYMSPEQAMGKRGDELDGRSDLYSLGIVMYQMLTGDLPFKADTTMEMLLAHLQQPAPNVRAVRPDLQIPDSIANVVMRLLEKKPENRPANARVLIEEIEQAEAELGSPGETRLIGPPEIYRPPAHVPPPVAPPAKQPMGANRTGTAPVAPPPKPPRHVEPPRSIEPQHPVEPRRAPVPPSHPMARAPVPVARARKSSPWGIWTALGILVVGLGVGAWYFTERQPNETPQTQSPPSQPSSPDSLSVSPTSTPANTPQTETPVATETPARTESPTPLTPGASSPPGQQQPSGSATGTGSSGAEVRTHPAVSQPELRPGSREAVRPPEGRRLKPAVDARRINAAIKMGEFYLERGEYEKAIDEFRQGLALDPSNLDLRNRILRARRAKAAEDQLNQ